MKIVILNCFESNEERLRLLEEAFFNRGYAATIYTTDFSHGRKEKRDEIPEGWKTIVTKPYRKNLSIRRILSHLQFAKDAFRQIEKEDPDLIWIMAPANSLIAQAHQYRKTHRNVKIIIDMIDMWPESLPVSISKKLLPFRIWRSIRRKNIICADLVTCECKMYQEILKEEYSGPLRTLHWAKKGKALHRDTALPEVKLSLCYIGSINHLIDIEKITGLIVNCSLPVITHVIGSGENTEKFLQELKKVCEVEYHGEVRDEEKKSAIFSKCHAGINIYKEGLYIGLTVKCLDYLRNGLPLINNIKGDTWRWVEEEKIGINVSSTPVLDAQKLIEMRRNQDRIIDFYNERFTEEVFEKRCTELIDEVLK